MLFGNIRTSKFGAAPYSALRNFNMTGIFFQYPSKTVRTLFSCKTKRNRRYGKQYLPTRVNLRFEFHLKRCNHPALQRHLANTHSSGKIPNATFKELKFSATSWPFLNLPLKRNHYCLHIVMIGLCGRKRKTNHDTRVWPRQDDILSISARLASKLSNLLCKALSSVRRAFSFRDCRCWMSVGVAICNSKYKIWYYTINFAHSSNNEKDVSIRW